MKIRSFIPLFFTLISLFSPGFLRAQQLPAKTVFTSDIDNFWIAYDSISKTSDREKQLDHINKLYISKATDGLKAFMVDQGYSGENYLKLINQYPLFWHSVRQKTIAIRQQVPEIEKSIERLRALYPELKPAGIYFTIGGLKSAGSTAGNKVLIGTEIAAADTGTNAVELTTWLRTLFSSQVSGNIVGMNIHEYVHTQQKPGANTLLAQALTEGSADFVAELATRQKNLNDYMIYGQNNEETLKLKFRSEMWRRSAVNWLYNGDRSEHPELGYFMGFVICRAYYNKSADKKLALREIIELDFSSRDSVRTFLEKSGYYGNANVRIQ